MSTALQTRVQLEQAQQNKTHLARVNEALKQIYLTKLWCGRAGRSVPTKLLRPSKAASEGILDLCSTYSGVPKSVCVPSPQVLLEIAQRQPEVFLARFGPEMFATTQELREEAIQEILVLLRIARQSIRQFELDNEKSRLNLGFTLGAIRNRRDYLLEAIRLSGKSNDQIRSELERARKAEEPLPQQLPQELSPKKLERMLREMTRQETDRFFQKWGVESINASLRRRDGWTEQVSQ